MFRSGVSRDEARQENISGEEGGGTPPPMPCPSYPRFKHKATLMSNTLTPNTVTPASPPEPVVQGANAPKRAARTGARLRCRPAGRPAAVPAGRWGAALTLVPFYLMLALSLKTDEEVAQSPWALPHVPQWGSTTSGPGPSRART